MQVKPYGNGTSLQLSIILITKNLNQVMLN